MTHTLVEPRAAAGAAEVSPEELQRRAMQRRAVEAVVWGMPAVNYDLMLQAFARLGGGPNQVAYWSRLLDWRNQTLTPNPDTVYFNPFYDTKPGPMVLEIPPADGGSITGSIDDCWQCALADVGPAGADKGAGGRYLILPPDHDADVPDGYIVLRSDTYQGYAILRSNVASSADADVAEAVAYGRRIRFYPLGQALDPPETRLVDLSGVLYETTIPYDRRFFRSLARMVDSEPWLARDKAMIDPLQTLGVAKGKPYAPDAAAEAVFDAAAAEAQAWIDMRREALFASSFYPGSHWALPAAPEVVKGNSDFYGDPDAYPVDWRAVSYSMGYFSPKRLGAGQFYLMALRDRDGRPLDGGATYRLHVPPDAPVQLYWSATAYDRRTHALIREVPRASRASNSPDIEINADGSVDLWFAPTAPQGRRANWVPTRPDRGFEALFRLYGPTAALSDKTWVLPDIEQIA